MRELVDLKCRGLSNCLQECKEAVKEVKKHICFQNEDIVHYLKRMAWRYDPWSVMFFSQLESCDTEMALQSCNGGDNGDNASDTDPSNTASVVQTWSVLQFLSLYFVWWFKFTYY